MRRRQTTRRRYEPSELSNFARRHSWLNGIESLCLAENTTLEDARLLLQRAVEREKQGITYNNLHTKCRVLRAALEHFSEAEAYSLAGMMLGVKGWPRYMVDWAGISRQFEELLAEVGN